MRTSGVKTTTSNQLVDKSLVLKEITDKPPHVFSGSGMLELLKMKVGESKRDEGTSVAICPLPCSMPMGGGVQEVIGKMSVKIFERAKKLHASPSNMGIVVAEFIDGIEA